MRKKPPEGGVSYKVKDGQWVGSIAMEHGFADWEADVWQHGNNAQLRDLREDPHLLAEGDELFIPPWEEHTESCGTEQKHQFRMKVPSEVIRIRVLDPAGEPLINEAYQLSIQCGSGGGVFRQKNETTDDEGMLSEEIPSTAREGRLCIPSLEMEFNLQFGRLTPMDSSDSEGLTRSAQERLKSVGFDPGPIDGVNGPRTKAAAKSFQTFCADEENKNRDPDRITDSGPADGIIGSKTQAALVKYYGC